MRMNEISDLKSQLVFWLWLIRNLSNTSAGIEHGSILRILPLARILALARILQLLLVLADVR